MNKNNKQVAKTILLLAIQFFIQLLTFYLITATYFFSLASSEQAATLKLDIEEYLTSRFIISLALIFLFSSLSYLVMRLFGYKRIIWIIIPFVFYFILILMYSVFLS